MPFDPDSSDELSVNVPADLIGPGLRKGVRPESIRVIVSRRTLADRVSHSSARDRDLLVVQTDTPGLDHPRSRVMLRALGLTGTGSAQVLPSRSPTVRRMLGSTSDYVYVISLALLDEPEAADTLPAEADMTEERYEIAGGEGIQFSLADGERLNLEPRDSYYSMAWTTALPLTTLIPRLQELLRGGVDGELTVFANNETGPPERGLARDLLGRVLERSAPASFWRLDADDLTLTWEARTEADTVGQPGLLGVIADGFKTAEVQELLQATATPLLGARASVLVEQCAEAVQGSHLLTAG